MNKIIVVLAIGVVMIIEVYTSKLVQRRLCRSEHNCFEGKKVRFIEDINDIENADGVRGHLEAVGEVKLTLSIYDKYIKRFIDIVLTIAGVAMLLPVWIVIILAIKIDDPGPIFFLQKRIGQNKKYFYVYKFRSMKMSTPHDTPTHMLENPEQYITNVGKFLRAHSLDELPQLFNVLDGSLSLVGPRPALWNQDVLIAERDKYNVNIFKPGITGWAQINGRDTITIDEKARLDEYWKNHRTLLFDLKCLLGTIIKVGHDDTILEGGTGAIDEDIPFFVVSENDIKKNKILIIGENSYIGNNFKNYIEMKKGQCADICSSRNEEWKKVDFRKYSVVYYVAGIAHIKENVRNRELYYKVNRDLAVEVAKYAKEKGIEQFIYLSSMSVYGMRHGIIKGDTKVNPNNAYGKSKAEAEKLLWNLHDRNFTVSILRPPMVYGKGCKGNYVLLRKFALKCLFFPKYMNYRSMLYVDNLSSVVCKVIEQKVGGVIVPQNAEYMCTYDMVLNIAKVNGKKVIGVKVGNALITILKSKVSVLEKVFGDLVYVKELNVPNSWLDYIDNSKTIELTEK